MPRTPLHSKQNHLYAEVFERLASTSPSLAQWERATKSWWMTYTGSVSSLQFNSLSIPTFQSILIIKGLQRVELCQTGALCRSRCCSVSLWDGACRWIPIPVGCVSSVVALRVNHNSDFRFSCCHVGVFNCWTMYSLFYFLPKLSSGTQASVCVRAWEMEKLTGV